MQFNQLKEKLANQPSDDEMAAFEQALAAQNAMPEVKKAMPVPLPSPEQNKQIQLERNIQEQKLRDAERERLGVPKFENLRNALREPASAQRQPASWEPKREEPQIDKLKQQLIAEQIKEQMAMSGAKSGGELIEQQAQQRAAEEQAKLSRLQQLMKGGTPGTVDFAKQK
jgi:hypothetical protein